MIFMCQESDDLWEDRGIVIGEDGGFSGANNVLFPDLDGYAGLASYSLNQESPTPGL